MGQIVIQNVDDALMRQLEQHAAAMHMTPEESVRRVLFEMVAQMSARSMDCSDPLAGSLRRYAPTYIPLDTVRERLWAEVAQDADHCG
ncbi:MAG: hypothetical protein HQL91_05785 [Magnetococcales bacterium]|nr:hypothetical protein [Magnetococcales bacterium]